MQKIKSFLVVGGGTAGWLTATTLAHYHRSIGRSDVRISLVESPQIGTIGVGEATIPSFIDTIKSLGINETDFIKHTQATFKLGIKFSQWQGDGTCYNHPFGQVGQAIDHYPFYAFWRHAALQDEAKDWLNYSPTHHMLEQNKFFVPQNAPNTPIQAAAYALHLDAGKAASYLADYARNLGVEHISGEVSQIQDNLHGVAGVELKDGRQLKADFFFDCTGFKSLIVGKHLQSKFDNWSSMLSVNRAVTAQTAALAPLPNYTESRAQDAGWTWHIPLQQRTGNGYVFNAEHCSDQEALDTLRSNVTGEFITEPRFIDFTSGMRPESWRANCIAIGLSSGFLEPLESTAIHLITKALRLFLRYYPTDPNDKLHAQAFNQALTSEYEEIKDFILAHYCLSGRFDTPFWQHYKQLAMPDSLQQKIDLFRHSGNLTGVENGLFNEVNWLSIFTGLGVYPEQLPPHVTAISLQYLSAHLESIDKSIQHAVDRLPTHDAFINLHCKAPLV